MTDKVLGIDLGTTNSAVAVVEGDGARTLPNRRGHETTPSVFRKPELDDDKETPYIGRVAERGEESAPERTVRSIKRRMGDGEALMIGGEQYTPPEISSYILRFLRKDAADGLGLPFEHVDNAVITVPAYFSEDQRQATRRAAEMAEFNSIDIINEPTAAAMAYGYRTTSEQETLLVYDLGGGTFDVSVLEIGEGSFRVQATGGDRHLGGDDWDMEVAEWIANKFEEEYGKNPLEKQPDEGAGAVEERKRRLVKEAKTAKEDLSTQGGKVTIILNYLMEIGGEPISDFKLDLDLATFNRITGHLVSQTVDPVNDAIEQSGCQHKDIETVLLTGGATRMPQVRDQLVTMFDSETVKRVSNPDEAVAKGAAIHGNEDNVFVQEVTPLSLGIRVQGGKFTRLIERNKALPAENSKIFTTSEGGQTSAQIEVLQGEHKIAKKNRSLRTFHVTGIPVASRGVPQIEVTFRVDREGIVTARAQLLGDEENTGTEVTISGAADITPDQVEQHIRRARQEEEEDERRVSLIEQKNEAKKLVNRANNILNNPPDSLPLDEQSELADACERVETHLDRDKTTLGELREASEKLETTLIAAGNEITQTDYSYTTTPSTEEDQADISELVEEEIGQDESGFTPGVSSQDVSEQEAAPGTESTHGPEGPTETGAGAEDTVQQPHGGNGDISTADSGTGGGIGPGVEPGETSEEKTETAEEDDRESEPEQHRANEETIENSEQENSEQEDTDQQDQSMGTDNVFEEIETGDIGGDGGAENSGSSSIGGGVEPASEHTDDTGESGEEGQTEEKIQSDSGEEEIVDVDSLSGSTGSGGGLLDDMGGSESLTPDTEDLEDGGEEQESEESGGDEREDEFNSIAGGKN
jgi:molecular chaperone DnaK